MPYSDWTYTHTHIHTPLADTHSHTTHTHCCSVLHAIPAACTCLWCASLLFPLPLPSLLLLARVARAGGRAGVRCKTVRVRERENPTGGCGSVGSCRAHNFCAGGPRLRPRSALGCVHSCSGVDITCFTRLCRQLQTGGPFVLFIIIVVERLLVWCLVHLGQLLHFELPIVPRSKLFTA